jgi:hypothetical protein
MILLVEKYNYFVMQKMINLKSNLTLKKKKEENNLLTREREMLVV